MNRTSIHIIPRIFTRRALVGMIETQQQDRDRKPAHPAGARSHTKFPLTLTIGLMTIGVILIISLLQLLTSWLG